MTNAEELKSFIDDRCKNILLPCKNFPIYGHCNRLDDPECRGDLLVAIGLFSVMGYLGKIWWILSGKQIPKDANNEYNNINETDAFTNMVKTLPDSVALALGIEKLQKCPANDPNVFWDGWRNKLSHLLTPNADKVVITNWWDKAFEFEERGNYWTCNVFGFREKLCDVVQWLSDQVDSAEAVNVSRALDYITTKLSYEIPAHNLQ